MERAKSLLKEIMESVESKDAKIMNGLAQRIAQHEEKEKELYKELEEMQAAIGEFWAYMDKLKSIMDGWYMTGLPANFDMHLTPVTTAPGSRERLTFVQLIGNMNKTLDKIREYSEKFSGDKEWK